MRFGRRIGVATTTTPIVIACSVMLFGGGAILFIGNGAAAIAVASGGSDGEMEAELSAAATAATKRLFYDDTKNFVAVGGGGGNANGSAMADDVGADSRRQRSASVDAQALNVYFHQAALRAFLKAKAARALRGLPRVESALFTQCADSAASVLQLCGCVVRALDARDESERRRQGRRPPSPNKHNTNDDDDDYVEESTTPAAAPDADEGGGGVGAVFQPLLSALFEVVGHYFPSLTSAPSLLIRRASPPPNLEPTLVQSTPASVDELEASRQRSLQMTAVATATVGDSPPRAAANVYHHRPRTRRKRTPLVTSTSDKRTHQDLPNVAALYELRDFVALYNRCRKFVRGMRTTLHDEKREPQTSTSKGGDDDSSVYVLSPRLFSNAVASTRRRPTKRGRILSPTLFTFGEDEEGLLAMPTVFGSLAAATRHRLRFIDNLMETFGVGRLLRRTVARLAPIRRHFERFAPIVERLEELSADYARIQRTHSAEQLASLRDFGYAWLRPEQSALIYEGTTAAKDDNDENALSAAEELEALAEEEIRELAALLDRTNDKGNSLGVIGTMSETPVSASSFVRRGKRQTVFAQPLVFTDIRNVMLRHLVLRPRAFDAELHAPQRLQFQTLSPQAFFATIQSPQAVIAQILSPGAFLYNFLSDQLATAQVLAPFAFEANVLSPLTAHAEILSPVALQFNLLSPGTIFAMILSPQTLTADILAPQILQFKAGVPERATLSVLSPEILIPYVYSPSSDLLDILSPDILVPKIRSHFTNRVAILSPEIFSPDDEEEEKSGGEKHGEGRAETGEGEAHKAAAEEQSGNGGAEERTASAAEMATREGQSNAARLLGEGERVVGQQLGVDHSQPSPVPRFRRALEDGRRNRNATADD